jgi:hypothetical protein
MSRAVTQSLGVYELNALLVVDGANLGDSLGVAEDLQCDDVYHLGEYATRQDLVMRQLGPRHMSISEKSKLGTPGAALHLDCCVSFMGNDGSTVDVVVLVEVDEAGLVANIFALPLGPMRKKTDYRIIGVETDGAERKFAEAACVSFTRGTLISLASGAQRAVEDLREGDMVLTRDDGPQPVRWIGQSTVRATGDFAPIRIDAGTLNNANDLLVSPDHRLFIYQRRDHLGAGRSELLIKAHHLINGESVRRVEGGHVDYFQILFDAHQIIYAEGIAAETLLVDSRTRAALPEELDKRLTSTLPTHTNRLRAEFELNEALVRRPDAVALLRRASTR